MRNLIKYIMISFFSIAVYKYCIVENSNRCDKKVYIAKNTEKIFDYIFLMDGNNEILKNYTIEVLQEYIIWLSRNNKNINYNNDMCSILNNSKLKNGLTDKNNKKLEKAIKKIVSMCKK